MQRRSLFNAGSRQFLGGLALHESALPAVAAVCTVPEMINLYNAVQVRHQSFLEAVDGVRQAFLVQAEQREQGRAFIEKARDVLVPFLGSAWSAAWAPAGFAGSSLAIPTSVDRVIETLGGLERYFKKNPAQQSVALNITEALARQARENLEVAVATVAQGRRDQRNYRGMRDSADTALDEKLATGRKVLAAVLPEDDARWLDFRPDVPGDLDRPDQVEGVQAQPGTPGRLRVSWEPSARADRYIVQVLVEGQDTAFRNVATVLDPGADVEVGPGARVQVRVIARNAAGPTVPSDTLQATAPLAVAA